MVRCNDVKISPLDEQHKHVARDTTLRILIVEDEAILAMHMSCVLEDAGHDVIGTAVSTREALALVETSTSGPPDVALVDVNLLDGATGPALGRRLALEHGTHVVFVTANPREIGSELDAAVGVVEKPWTEEMLAAVVDHAGSGVPASRTLQPCTA